MNSPAPAGSPELPPLHSVRLGTSGPAMVLLHGWGRSLEALRPLGELLAAHCQVILVDLPGFGGSPLPFAASNEGGGWSTEDYALRVKEWLDSQGIQRCILLGHSFGGRVSVRLAARYPRLAQGLILVGSHGLRSEKPFRHKVRARLIRLVVSLAKRVDGLVGTRLFPHYLAPRFGSRDYRSAGDLRKTLVKTVNEDLSTLAQSIEAPTLLLWGEDDTETPPNLARNFSRLIKESDLFIFPHKGHEPFADVGSHLLAAYIERFLNERGLRAA